MSSESRARLLVHPLRAVAALRVADPDHRSPMHWCCYSCPSVFVYVSATPHCPTCPPSGGRDAKRWSGGPSGSGVVVSGAEVARGPNHRDLGFCIRRGKVYTRLISVCSGQNLVYTWFAHCENRASKAVILCL